MSEQLGDSWISGLRHWIDETGGSCFLITVTVIKLVESCASNLMSRGSVRCFEVLTVEHQANPNVGRCTKPELTVKCVCFFTVCLVVF